MALKEFCQNLQRCADKLEMEIKLNINDCHNLIFAKQMDETKLALERAKDYHYSEIMTALTTILEQVKIIIFHQDKIDWLSDEHNISIGDLKRFSYVKRQVYAFSKPEETRTISRSEENLSATPSRLSSKRERRKTASEISLGTLDTWEKFMEHKEREEEEMKQTVLTVERVVPKRTTVNSRARKKFVSSTMGGFLEDSDAKRANLESICESICDEAADETGDTQSGMINSVNSDTSWTESQAVCDVLKNIELESNKGDESLNKAKDLVNAGTKPKIVDVVYKKQAL